MWDAIESAAADLSLDAEEVVERLQEQQNNHKCGISRIERFAAIANKKARVAVGEALCATEGAGSSGSNGPEAAQEANAYTILDVAMEYNARNNYTRQN